MDRREQVCVPNPMVQSSAAAHACGGGSFRTLAPHSSQATNSSASIAGVAMHSTSTTSITSKWSRSSVAEECNSTSHSAVPRLLKASAHAYSYVDGLVDAAVLIVRRLWADDCGLPADVLRHFIVETSRRSKTSLSTMQLALMYCLRVRRTEDAHAYDPQPRPHAVQPRSVDSGRHNFLSALILASKYLQDRNFSNKAWAKISMVDVADVNANERRFLAILDWNLHITCDRFKRWTDLVGAFTVELREATLFGDVAACEARLGHLLDKCLHMTDADIVTAMQSTAPVMTNIEQQHIEIRARLDEVPFTPVDSPSSTCAADYISAQQPSIDLAEQDTGTTSDDDNDAGADASSLFDEFIKATPLLQPIAAAGNAQICLTPESMDDGNLSDCDSAVSSPGQHSRAAMAPQLQLPPSPAASFTSESGLDLMLCPALVAFHSQALAYADSAPLPASADAQSAGTKRPRAAEDDDDSDVKRLRH